jgi:hypothetical protein
MVKYSIPLKNDLNKALNTLNSNLDNVSRTDGQKPPGATHKKGAVSYGAIVGQPAYLK